MYASSLVEEDGHTLFGRLSRAWAIGRRHQAPTRTTPPTKDPVSPESISRSTSATISPAKHKGVCIEGGRRSCPSLLSSRMEADRWQSHHNFVDGWMCCSIMKVLELHAPATPRITRSHHTEQDNVPTSIKPRRCHH